MLLQESLLAVFWIISAFVISKVSIPVIILVAKRKRLLENDEEDRKIHKGLIPAFGGVAIFLSLLVSFSASSFADQFPGYGYFVAASVILFSAGLKDDILVISPLKKVFAQLAAIVLIIFGSGIYFTDLGGVFGIQAIPDWAGILLTLFMMVVVINAVNLVDGIDGLAGSIGIIASLFFGFWFYIAGFFGIAVLSGILAASLAGFLWYNVPPAKIFMGDTGSLLVGLYLSIFSVLFVNYSVSNAAITGWQHAAPILAAAILVVPLYDTLRIFIVRVFNGSSPFHPDTEHVHHHLLRMNMTHGQATIYLSVITLLVAGSTLLLSYYISNTWLFFWLLAISCLVFPTNSLKRAMLEKFTDYSMPGGKNAIGENTTEKEITNDVPVNISPESLPEKEVEKLEKVQ